MDIVKMINSSDAYILENGRYRFYSSAGECQCGEHCYEQNSPWLTFGADIETMIVEYGLLHNLKHLQNGEEENEFFYSDNAPGNEACGSCWHKWED